MTSSDPALLSAVRGQRLLAVCVTPYAGLFQSQKASVWRKAASSFTFKLQQYDGVKSVPQPNTADIFACSVASQTQGSIEEVGGACDPFSRAAFTHAGLFEFPEVPRSPVEAVASSKLESASAGLDRFVAADWFPSARNIVTKLDAVLAQRKLAANVRYAATVADVTDPNAVYVVASGSNSTSAELAVLASNGKPYVMQCQRNGTTGPLHEA